MPFAAADDEGRRTWLLAQADKFLPVDLKSSTRKGKAERARWICFIMNAAMQFPTATGLDVDDPDVKTKVSAWIVAARAFLDEELGDPATDVLPATAGTLNQRTPALIDLVDAHRTRGAMTAAGVAKKAKTAGIDRKDRVRKIALRAMALHRELWSSQNVLDKEALREIIDRRLRITEMVHYFVNTVDNQAQTWTVAPGPTPDVPIWKDGERNRLFEYPLISFSRNFGELLREARNAHLIKEKFWDGRMYAPQPSDPAQQWDWLVSPGNQMTWDHPPPYPEDPVSATELGPVTADEMPPPDISLVTVRMPTKKLREQWQPSPKDKYTLLFYPKAGGLSLVESIDLLGNVRDANGADVKVNFWDRGWMNCDHVLSLLLIEALLYGWRRRKGAAIADAKMDALPSDPHNNPATLANTGRPHENKYVWLGPMVQIESGNSAGLLDGGGGNPFFSARLKSFGELQIGDHVIYWNSGVYDLLTSGLWRLENAVVMDVSETVDGKLDLDGIVLEGHGLKGNSAKYAEHFLGQMNGLLDDARGAVADEIASNPTAITANVAAGTRAIKWLPYPGLQPGTVADGARIGCWWLVFRPDNMLWKKKRKATDDATVPSVLLPVREAVIEVPGTVGVVAGAGGTTYNVVTGVRGATGFMELQDLPAGSGFVPFTQAHPDLTLDGYVVFPLVVPKMKVDVTKSPFLWAHYFKDRSTGVISTKQLTGLKMDSSFLPGLRRRDYKLWANGPRVRTTPLP